MFNMHIISKYIQGAMYLYYCILNLSEATWEAGTVAAAVEQCKKSKYSNLVQSHQFTPVVFETSGVMGPRTETFLKDLRSHLKWVSGDDEAYIHLLQRFSIVIQRGTVLLCWAVLASFLTESPTLFNIILLLNYCIPQCFYFVIYCLLLMPTLLYDFKFYNNPKLLLLI